MKKSTVCVLLAFLFTVGVLVGGGSYYVLLQPSVQHLLLTRPFMIVLFIGCVIGLVALVGSLVKRFFGSELFMLFLIGIVLGFVGIWIWAMTGVLS
ncbi:hypothetical protein [Paenibacillus sp. S-12]|uniref:hypothetical protein n=1 Tax=Paenibacillus sp. S-12 TaxID=3031371 RepID=UPI0025A1B367|nr:hypothetical protein [Paenibacillus sp. S-12]